MRLLKKWKARRGQPAALSPEQYLADFPTPIQVLAHEVRTLVRQALPESTEKVRLGWKAICLYFPSKPQPVYFGFIIPHLDRISFGFTFGTLVDDLEQMFLGADENLVRVRYLTLRTTSDIRPALFTTMLHQAVEAALLPKDLRFEMASQAYRQARRK